MKNDSEILPSLSNREREILSLLAHGFNQVQVADKIFLSPHTVNFHVRNILDKFSARNCTAAVALALSHQQISL